MKKIAVIICGITYESQQEFVRGVIGYGQEHGINIYIFNCCADYGESEEYKQGAFQVYDLMYPEEYDGAIILKDTLHYKEAQEKIIRRIQESRIPAISIDARVSGMGYSGVDNYRAIYELTKHIIEVHGVREIAYVNGPLDNADSRDRKRAYQDVLEQKGICCNGRWLYQGDFSVESGAYAVKEFIRMNWMPKAIICANDNMAVGAIMELQEQGYRVPEDVIVTGFDDSRKAINNAPCITTVNPYREKMGYQACECVATMDYEEIQKVELLTEAKVIYTESCGCKSERIFDAEKFRKQLVRMETIGMHYKRSINEMFTKFMSYTEPEEIFREARKYVPELKAESFYIGFMDVGKVIEESVEFHYRERCGEKNLGLRREEGEYSLPLMYENGRFSVCDKLPKGKLLPEESDQRNAGSFYYILPIHYQEKFFGYCMVGECMLSTEVHIFCEWLKNIGICIENVIKTKILRSIMEKLDQMRICDGLTGLYNRMGFNTKIQGYKQMAKTSGRNLFISFLDIDGLKMVNDTYGHQEGDWLIRTVADCMKEAANEEEICMRFGGDEFVLLGLENIINSRHQEFEQKFKENLQQINRKKPRDYQVSASIGSYVIEDMEHTNIEAVMDKADTEMYAMKQKRKEMQER
ncbi:MAG: GGDEF domain-containing protein [Lachnospiraceae bacterium]|nr:GGDEF domain-containing protein [Lachnospiraceae bacterium]MDD7378118.1 GGDEF domain-containing protein [Lachnospiraceae bacterium]MDY4617362.1 GGDEF domain-containing protein [Lachnospiraceae bacterium]MDY5774711.1 GGDEF domain-containing protein [Lachnospiraceae bacterium]